MKTFPGATIEAVRSLGAPADNPSDGDSDS
jgi:hypothetical protein